MAKKNNLLNFGALTKQMEDNQQDVKTLNLVENKESEQTIEIDEKIENKLVKNRDVLTTSSQNVKTTKQPKEEFKHRKTVYITDSNIKLLKKLIYEKGKDMSFYVNKMISESKENK